MAEKFGKIFTSRDKLTHEALNAAFLPIYAEIEALRATRADYEAQITLFNSEGIKRVSEAVKPLIDQIGAAIDGGLLVAQTDDLVAIVGGAEIDFLIPEASRVAFRPTPFLAITAPDVRDDWAIGRVLVYNDTTGLLKLEILYLNGSGGARTGWTVAASSGVVEAVYQWMTEVTAMRDQVSAWRDEVAQKWADVNAAAILIAGGPVSSINGTLTGAVTGVAMEANHYTKAAMDTALAARDTAISGKADAEATTTALGLKANSDDVAASLAALDERATELTKDFIASGAVAFGQFVALRSDGKVEVVAGTETLASVGADATLSVAQTMNLVHSAYNPATAKIAVLYYNASTANTMYLVVGTVAGGSITFGSPLTIGSIANYFNFGAVGWSPSGSLLFVYYRADTGMKLQAGSVSGTTVTLGSAATLVAGVPTHIFHDDTHGSRIIAFDDAGVVAATYSGTTLTVGARVALTLTNTSNRAPFYDGVNARGVVMGGQDNGGTVYVKAFTVAGTTITVGAEASASTYWKSAAYDFTSGKAVFFSYSSGAQDYLHGSVVTFSGAVSTINTRVKLTDFYFVTYPGRVVHDASSGKIVIAGQSQSQTTPTLQNGAVLVCTISGTTISASALTGVETGTTVDSVFSSTSGATSRIAIVYRSEFDYQRYRVTSGRIVSGQFVVDDVTLIRSSPQPHTSLQPAGSRFMVGGWTLFNLGNWSQAASNLTCFGVVLPDETTNADAWIGVAKASVADGANVTVALRGGIDKQRSGLTPNTPYFLKGDGTLIANDNGRPAGIALSSTELLMEAA